MKRSAEVWIVAAAAQTALGQEPGPLWQRLSAGNSGQIKISRFATTPYYCHQAALINESSPPHDAKQHLESMLEHLVQSLDWRPPPGCELIGASLKGNIAAREHLWREAETTEKDARLLLQPAHFLGQKFDLKAPGLNIGAACASSSAALALAASRIAQGHCPSVLVWGAEIITEFVFAGFSALKALSPGSCRPFDRRRNGLMLGEGAALLLLMQGEEARKLGFKPQARISGWGLANDAVHLTAPARDGRGLIRAGQRALRKAALKPEDIAAIKAHGTGTIHNDAMEIAAFNKLFGKRIPPLFSLKGALGHTLGAAGAIETVIALHCLQEKRLPPTLGLRQAEPAIAASVSRQARDFSGRNLLLTNSGFGGINCALILEPPK